MNRLTDNDRQFGPVTYAPCSGMGFSIKLSSAKENDGGLDKHNSIVLYAFGWVFRILLPNLIKPYAHKVIAKGWDEATVKRLGRDYYVEYFPRQYGFSLWDDHFTLYHGFQSGFGNMPEGMKEQRWGYFLPWKQKRMVRHTYYNLDGSIFWEWANRTGRGRYDTPEHGTAPSLRFAFKDYDGEDNIATCHVEEREWWQGEKWCSWLSWFTKPFVRRYLELWFDKEVGPQKGSWKGGTIGTSTNIAKGESMESAFKRYCEKKQERKGREFSLTFVGPTTEPPPPKPAPHPKGECDQGDCSCHYPTAAKEAQ